MKGKGTTLADLNKAYDKQASKIAERTMRCHEWWVTDSWFFELGYEKRKLLPRGKVFIKLLTLCGEADIYD